MTVDNIKIRQREIELDLGDKLIVLEKLLRPHALVIATKKRAAARIKGYWNSNMYEIHSHALDISTTTENMPRALRFFDRLIKVLKLRGHDVIANNETLAKVFDEEIQIRLREKNKLIKVMDGKRQRTERKRTGLLYFGAKLSWSSDKVWIDSTLVIEQQVSNIVAYLEIKAEQLREHRRQQEIEERKQEELDRQREERKQMQERELSNFKLLLNKVERWQRLNLIRGYINELENKCIEQNLLTEDVKDWIVWARRKADWYDPHINAEDDLLKDVDKEMLTL
jgi:hypothetical protein